MLPDHRGDLGGMKAILLSAERELRATGALSEATCLAFAQADPDVRRGFESSFAFLGCPAVVAAAHGDVVPPQHRVEAVRLMLLRLRAHTDEPRWSSRVLDELCETARRPAGSTIGDIVRGLFAVFAECPVGLTDIQANFIQEVSTYIVGRRHREYAIEDFSWLADALTGTNATDNAAQAYLAVHTLPPPLASKCRDSILRALHLTRFEDDVRRELDD